MSQHPPLGTYPPDEATASIQAPAWQPPPPPEQPLPKAKRVGTFTVAFSLIAVGLLMILRLIMPGLDYALIAKLSPIILVAYGLEILLTGMLIKDRPLKYDLVGLVVAGTLVCASLLAAALPEAIVNEREISAIRQSLRSELDATSYSRLQAEGIGVAELDWYLEENVYGSSWYTGMTVADLDPADNYTQVRIRFAGDYATEAEFAAACRDALNAMGELADTCDYAIFYSNNHDDYHSDTSQPRFAVWLENNYQVNYTAADIAKLVEAEYWSDWHGGWIDADEYANYLAHPEEYAGEEPEEQEFPEDTTEAWPDEPALEGEPPEDATETDEDAPGGDGY